MTAIQLKTNLHSFIDNINDKTALQKIYSFLKKTAASTKDDYWDELSEAEKSAIEEGLTQLDMGKSLSFETVIKKAKKRYSNRLL
ncbi:MAG: hypothetical protein JNL63_04405 [Bacteroidia bacterium]|nr:hypothetical protein [Bacteroidia bacterium]